MTTKTLSRIEIKDATKGEVSVVFAVFDVVDKDGDVTLPGAFEEGATVPISAYGHSSWDGAPPVGIGTIRSTAKEAILDGRFFMDQAAGRDTFIAVAELAKQNLGEWSYGYDPLEFSFGEHKGQQVRFLAKQKVFEVSPVLVGAGVGTRTRSAKADAGDGVLSWRAIRPHTDVLTDRPWDAKGVVEALGPDATITELRSVFAYCSGDPVLKASYSFPHHHGADGPANVRALIVGIAELNAKTCSLPAVDRQAVYEHLAGHLNDADREPPPLRKSDEPATYLDDAYEYLVGAHRFIDTTDRVVALRSQKGKRLTAVTAEALDWALDEARVVVKQLAALSATPQEAAAREQVRFLRHQFQQEQANV